MKSSILQSNNSKLIRLLYKSYIPKIINAAIELSLFEVLSKNSLQLPELSEKLKIDAFIGEAFLDVLIGLELISKINNTYSLTPNAEDFLVSSSAFSQLDSIKKISGSSGPFDNLVEILKTGSPSEFNNKMWSSKEAVKNIEQQQKGGAIPLVLSFIKEIPEFKNCRKMCDFAGNVGYFSFAFIQENPQLMSHVYDLPEVCAIGREIKSNEEYYDQVTYHDYDTSLNDSFGNGYDLFFISHFIYDLNFKGILTDFLKKVNRSMKTGGIFLSNHISNSRDKNHLTLLIVQLMTRMTGYPTHQLPEEDLKSALTNAGFSKFKAKNVDDKMPYPILLFSAVKTAEIF